MKARGQGKTVNWLRSHANYDGSECLLWPFSKTRGYGQFTYLGKLNYATRFMCELINGAPPSPDHEAAHSCRNGAIGCVHPRHLSWKTRKQNMEDKIADGTAKRSWGTKRWKLTPDQVASIREQQGQKTAVALAIEFSVSESTIIKIFQRKTWKTGQRVCNGFDETPWNAERRSQYGY